MTDSLAVFVYARDPLSQAGVLAILRDCPGISVVEANDIDRARVAIVVADMVTGEVTRVIRAIQRGGVPKVLAVVAQVDEGAVVRAVSAGASAVMKWSNADPPRLAAAVARTANTDDDSARRLVAGLMSSARGRVGGVQPATSDDRPVLSERDLAVLRLVADGHDTAEVASRLGFSESTIKGAIHEVMVRLDARNRSHAIAVALRGGLI